jgi:AcrR family transcriptional regulator
MRPRGQRRQPARPAAPRGRSAPPHDRILVAAKKLFAQKGYENTSTVAIARAAGTSESQLMKHFGSKEGLLEAIFDQAWTAIHAETQRRFPLAVSPAEKLSTLVNLMQAGLEQDPQLKLLMLLEGRRIRKEGHMVMLTSGFRAFVQVVDDVLRELREAGQLRSDVNIESLRSALMGAFEGLLRDRLLSQRVGFPAHFTVDEARHTFNSILTGFLSLPGRGAKSSA